MGQVPEKTEDDPWKGWKPSEFLQSLEHHFEVMNTPVFWGARGIGSEWNLPCLVTGEYEECKLLSNISGFVTSKEEGLRVVHMLFGGRAQLDFRPSYPDRIQVKVGVKVEHIDVLDRLMDANFLQSGIFTCRTVLWAIDPIHYVGYDPTDRAKRYMEHKMKT
jgi:hypothetical protein